MYFKMDSAIMIYRILVSWEYRNLYHSDYMNSLIIGEYNYVVAWWRSGLKRWSPNSGNTGSNPTQGFKRFKTEITATSLCES